MSKHTQITKTHHEGISFQIIVNSGLT